MGMVGKACLTLPAAPQSLASAFTGLKTALVLFHGAAKSISLDSCYRIVGSGEVKGVAVNPQILTGFFNQ